MARKLLFLLLCITLSESSRLGPCDMCPPGTYLVEECKKGHPHTTKCQPCPSGTYTQYYNHMDYCLRHRHCAGRNMIAHPGNATMDTICTCRKGYRKPFELDFELCLRNPLCPRGTSVTKRGNACRRCPRGFYSDHHSRTDFCRPWTNCTEYGKTVVERGSRTRDVTCGDRNFTADNWRNNVSNEGKPRPSIESIVPKVGIFTTPTLQQGLQLDINEVSTQPDKDASVFKTSEVIVISLLSFLVTCATSLLLFGLFVKCNSNRCRCRFKKQELRHGVQEEQVYYSDCGRNVVAVETVERCAENEPPCATIPQCEQTLCQERYFDAVVVRAVERCAENESPCATIPQCAQTLCQEDSVICDDTRDHDGEYNTFPKAHTMSSPATWSSCGSLPTVQDTSAALPSSPRLKSESSEEYMHEMQALIAEGYAKVLSASGAEYLAAELGPSWRRVAKGLGITQEQIDYIWNENRENLERQIIQMLCCWQRNRTGRASISELYGALLASNNETLCRKLQAMEHDSSMSEETKVYCL